MPVCTLPDTYIQLAAVGSFWHAFQSLFVFSVQACQCTSMKIMCIASINACRRHRQSQRMQVCLPQTNCNSWGFALIQYVETFRTLTAISRAFMISQSHLTICWMSLTRQTNTTRCIIRPTVSCVLQWLLPELLNSPMFQWSGSLHLTGIVQLLEEFLVVHWCCAFQSQWWPITDTRFSD